VRRWGLALGCLLTGLLAAAPAMADWNASGQFLYIDREFDPNGFTGNEPARPIRFAVVQVVEGSKVIGSGLTDSQGNFVFRVTDSRSRDLYVRCLAKNQPTSGLPIEVRAGNQSGDVWSVRTQTFLGHAPTQDLFIGQIAAIPGSGGEAFNLFEAAQMGGDYLVYLRGSALMPTLLIVFNASNSNLSSFQVNNNTIVQARNGGYDDTVVLHEMGHYVITNFSDTDSAYGTHHLSDCNQNLMLAFDEGHATFWGCSVRRFFNLPYSSAYVRTTGLAGPGNLQFSFDTETQQPFVCRGASSEMTVLAALWDLVDGPSTPDSTPGEEPWDLLQGLDREYWKVMTTYLPTPSVANISLEDFWDGWFHPSVANGRYPEVLSIFRELGVEYFTDPYEPNDLVSEAKQLVAGPGLTHLTYFQDLNHDLLGEADPDLFYFDALAGQPYTIETLNLLGDANTSLILMASNGTTVLASNDDRNLGDSSSVITYTPPQSGRLYIRSAHAADFGIYGSYDLRVGSGGAGIDADGDGYTADIDCDDGNASIHPGATEICNGVDDDCDGLNDEGFDHDADGSTSCGGDCNDANAAIHPGATEICDNIDNDCDGIVDEGFDADGDGYSSCGGDCRDTNPLVHPNQPEACNGIDDNCNGFVDEEFDGDADGYTSCGGDCNDSNAAINPGRTEACNGLDDDCDTLVDEGFADSDADGVKDCVDPDDDNDGVPDTLDCAPLVYFTTVPPGEVGTNLVTHAGGTTHVGWEPIAQTQVYNVYRGTVQIETAWSWSTICVMPEAAAPQFNDDTAPPPGSLYYYLEAGANPCGQGTVGSGTAGTLRPLVQPCPSPGRDSDGDLVTDLVDNCPLTPNPAQPDADRDGRGDACDNCPSASNPNQRDGDANGLGDVCQDADGDSYTADLDCRDDVAAIHPGAPELCNGQDDDCDGATDEGFGVGGACSAGVGACARVGVTVCDPGGSSSLCTAVPGTPLVEVCNSLDDDCDGQVDEGFDADGDGYSSCGGDCNDAIPAIHPGAIEIFNGLDDDCDNVIDDVIEVVTVSRATWQASNARLLVEATTNYPPGSVTLTVVGYGPMTYISTAGVYRLTITGVSNPGTVTVTSTAGGSASSQVTPI